MQSSLHPERPRIKNKGLIQLKSCFFLSLSSSRVFFSVGGNVKTRQRQTLQGCLLYDYTLNNSILGERERKTCCVAIALYSDEGYTTGWKKYPHNHGSANFASGAESALLLVGAKLSFIIIISPLFFKVKAPADNQKMMREKV